MAKIQVVPWGALAASWLLANQLWVNHLVPAAFMALSLIGVCTDATIEVCLVAILALPASGMALTWLVLALALNRIEAVRGAFARPSLPRIVFWSGLAFVAGALACSAVERGDTWVPAVFADAVVLAYAVSSRTRTANPKVASRAPD